jgi:signal transduction histidine kinase
MTGGTEGRAGDDERLTELCHLTASVGHHLINAFSAVVSNAELLRSRGAAATDPAELESLARAIIGSALGAANVARRLIEHARRLAGIGTDQAVRARQTVDLNQLIRELIEQHEQISAATEPDMMTANRPIAEKAEPRPSVPGSKVEWVLNLNSISAIPGEPSQLRSMLRFLIQNAREALPAASGTVSVTTLVDSRNWTIIEIRDSGCGMSSEVLKRATEPFFSTKEGHIGIGLTIAQTIWRRHRGSLSIESRPGEGTTVRLSAGPLLAPEPVDRSPRGSQEAQPTQPPADERPASR